MRSKRVVWWCRAVRRCRRLVTDDARDDDDDDGKSSRGLAEGAHAGAMVPQTNERRTKNPFASLFAPPTHSDEPARRTTARRALAPRGALSLSLSLEVGGGNSDVPGEGVGANAVPLYSVSAVVPGTGHLVEVGSSDDAASRKNLSPLATTKRNGRDDSHLSSSDDVRCT